MVEYIDLEPVDDKKSINSGRVHVNDANDREQAYDHPAGNKGMLPGLEFDDPNLDPDAIGDTEEDSPYPEVRSAVANTDDHTMPVSTIRAWFMGMCLAVLIPGLNQ